MCILCVCVLPAAVLQVSAGSAAGCPASCHPLLEEFGRAAAASHLAPVSPTTPSSAAPPPSSAGGEERGNRIVVDGRRGGGERGNRRLKE